VADTRRVATAAAVLRAAGDAAFPIQLTGLRRTARLARSPTLAALQVGIPWLADARRIAAALPACGLAAATDIGGARLAFQTGVAGDTPRATGGSRITPLAEPRAIAATLAGLRAAEASGAALSLLLALSLAVVLVIARAVTAPPPVPLAPGLDGLRVREAEPSAQEHARHRGQQPAAGAGGAHRAGEPIEGRTIHGERIPFPVWRPTANTEPMARRMSALP
jgi:hypothetical protein